MADNSSIPVASGNETFANKDIAGVKFPRHITVDSTGADVSVATAAGQTTANTALAAIETAIEGTLTVGLPTGAATAANQTTGNTSLAAIEAAVEGTLTVGTHAVTVNAGSALMGKVTIGNGTNDATIRAGSAAAVVTDPALVVTMRPDGMADPFAQYEPVAASQTNQVMGATGAVGDYLAGVIIIPSSTSPGAVTIKDGANAAITVFAGGAASINNLRTIVVPLGMYSTNGAWQITTGANETAIGVGKFT